MARSASAAATPPHGVTGEWMDGCARWAAFLLPEKNGAVFFGGQVGRFLICFFFRGVEKKKERG